MIPGRHLGGAWAAPLSSPSAQASSPEEGASSVGRLPSRLRTCSELGEGGHCGRKGCLGHRGTDCRSPRTRDTASPAPLPAGNLPSPGNLRRALHPGSLGSTSVKSQEDGRPGPAGKTRRRAPKHQHRFTRLCPHPATLRGNAWWLIRKSKRFQAPSAQPGCARGPVCPRPRPAEAQSQDRCRNRRTPLPPLSTDPPAEFRLGKSLRLPPASIKE